MAYIVCKSNLDLVSFLFVPALYSTSKFRLLVYTGAHMHLPHDQCAYIMLGDSIIIMMHTNQNAKTPYHSVDLQSESPGFESETLCWLHASSQ